MSRRNSFLVLGLLARGAGRRRAARDPGIAAPQVSDARPRPPGRARGDATGRSAAEPRAHGRGPRPLRRDHAESRRQARRQRSPTIYTQGNNQIVIQLPGVQDPEAAAEIIGTTAQLELFDLEDSLVGPSIPSEASRSRHVAVRPSGAGAGAGEGRRRRRRTTSSIRRRSASSPGRTAPRRRRCGGQEASCRAGAGSSRCPRA